MSGEIASLYAKIGADSSQFNRAMNGVDDRLNGAGRGFSLLGTAGHAAMVGIGAAVAVGAAAIGGLTAVVVSSTVAASKMEQQITDIGAVMGLTADETKRVGNLITDLGLDPKLKVSATEAADAIEMLGRNGLKLSEIMDGAARSTVLLANATGGDFATAADVATDAMAQFDIDAADMMDAVNGIVGVTTTSKFTIDDYRLALAQAGGVASAVGVSFKDFNTTISATSASFASGSDAGTSFKTFLQRLIPQSKEAESTMKELGIITADGANRFYDASGNMRSMAEIAGVLNRAFSGLTEEQKNATSATLFGTDAMRTAFELAGMTAEQFEALSAELGKTDAAQMAADRMNTLSGAMEIFNGVIETIRLQIGMKFLPLATRLIRWGTDIISRFAEPVTAWFSKVADSVGNVMDRVINAFDTGGLSGVVRELQNMGMAMAAAFGGWAIDAWQQTQRNLSAWFSNLMSWVMDPTKRRQLFEQLTAGWTFFADWAGNIYGGVLDGVSDMLTQLYEWISSSGNRENLFQALVDTWTMFADWAVILWKSLSPHMLEFVNKFVAWAGDPSVWKNIGDAIMHAWTFFSDWAGKVWISVAPRLAEFAGSLATWATDGSLWNGITATWKFITDWAGKVWAWAAPKLAEFAGSLWQWISDPGTWLRFARALADGWTMFQDWSKNVWVNVSPALVTFGGNLKRWIDDNAPVLTPWIDAFGKLGTSIAAGFNVSFPSAEKRLEEFATSIEDSLKRIMKAWTSVFGGSGEAGGVSGVGALVKSFGEYMGWMAGGLFGSFMEAWKLLSGQIIAYAETTIYALGAVGAAAQGDFAGAQQMLMNALDAAAEGNLLMNAMEDLNLWWNEHQQQGGTGGRSSSSFGGGGDVFNVYVNGEPVYGRVRAEARLGVTEALRARGGQ